MYTQIKEELKKIKTEIFKSYDIDEDEPLSEQDDEFLSELYESFEYIMEKYDIDEDELQEILDDIEDEESEWGVGYDPYDPEEIRDKIKEILNNIYQKHNISADTDFNQIEEDIKEELFDILDDNDIMWKYGLDGDEVEEIIEDIYWDRLEPVKLEELNNAIQYISSIDVWEKDIKSVYLNEQITAEILQNIIDEALNGKYIKVVIQLKIKGEETFIKRLNKTVGKEWVDMIVMHNTDGNMALLYFSGKKYDCYKLIHMEKCPCSGRDLEKISLGNVTLLECVVHNNKEMVAKGVSYIFKDIKDVCERLHESGRWCPEYPKGVNGFNKVCVEYGAVEETQTI